MPCWSRQEGENIAVFLFCPDPFFFGIRTGGIKERKLAAAMLANANMLKYVAPSGYGAIAYILSTRANEIRFTDMRPIRVRSEPEECLDKLFRELVL